MDQFLLLSIAVVIGALYWFVHHRWLRSASPKTMLYHTIGAAIFMAALCLLGSTEGGVVSGTLMALIFAVAISLRYRRYLRWKHDIA